MNPANKLSIVIESPAEYMLYGEFRRAFDGARNGEPFDYEHYDTLPIDDQCKYERGRLLALTYSGPLASGATVHFGALIAARLGRADGTLV